MGQCAPSSPSNYLPTSIDDDEIPIVLNTESGGGCYTMANRKDEKKYHVHFLQAHQPDIPQRRLLDQSEIKKAIWLQSDEILRHNGKLKMNGILADDIRGQHGVSPYHENQRNVSKVAIDPSIVSDITNASNTTLVRKNTIRSLTYENSNTLSGEWENGREQNVKSYSGNTDKFEKAERQHCMPAVLQLKMRAKLGWFYTQHYLKMFPRESNPTVGTVPGKEKWIPDLTRISSDGSFSSSDSDDTNYIKNRPMPPMISIKCPITNESLLDLAITGCLGLVPREQVHDALKPSRRQLKDCYKNIPDHCIVLIDKRLGSPLAVCVLDERFQSPVIQIYATKQMTFAQKHITTTKQLGLDWADDLALYRWAEVKAEGNFPDEMNFEIFMASAFDGCFASQPCYNASFDGRAIDDRLAFRSPVMKLVGRTSNERHSSGCALFWMQANGPTASDRSEESPDVYFRINIAQGIDPALLICFTAIVDEIIEKSMRTRCQTRTRGRIRKDSFALTKQRLEARSRQQRVSASACGGERCAYSHCIF